MPGIYDDFKDIVANICSPIFSSWGAKMPPFEIPDPTMGDLSLPCFTLAKSLKKAPKQIAEELYSYIEEKVTASPIISSAGPVNAYVNFTMDPKWAAEKTVPSILEGGYGDLPQKDEKVVLEHTSANPTDKLHVGRARNPIIGDTLARICRAAGYDVETQYYVDDMGRQAVTLAYGRMLWKREGAQDGFLGPYQYASHMVKEIEEHRVLLNSWIHALETQTEMDVDGTPLQTFVDKACKDVMENKVIPALERANIFIDKFVNESQFMTDGSVADVISTLQNSSDAGQDEENGAWYIDMAKYGVKGRTTRFHFTRGDGTSLYATRDVAYHLWKFNHYDRVVNVLGEDHKLEGKQVAVALNLVGEESVPEIVFYSFVGLPEGKMSTRRGQVVYIDDLLDEAIERAQVEVDSRRKEISAEKRKEIAEAVGIGAVRYNIIRVQPEKKITFRWEDALNFEGDSAPFIMYSHARACSILRKADGARQGDPSVLVHPSETTLIKHLARLPDIIDECASNMKPHLLAGYAQQTAMLFNQFYRDCKVVGSEEEGARLMLVKATKNVLASCLNILGIRALEEM